MVVIHSPGLGVVVDCQCLGMTVRIAARKWRSMPLVHWEIFPGKLDNKGIMGSLGIFVSKMWSYMSSTLFKNLVLSGQDHQMCVIVPLSALQRQHWGKVTVSSYVAA